MLSPLLEVQTVGQNSYPCSLCVAPYPLFKWSWTDRQSEVSIWDWISEFDMELDYLWHCIKANCKSRIHSGYSSIYNMYVFLYIVLKSVYGNFPINRVSFVWCGCKTHLSYSEWLPCINFNTLITIVSLKWYYCLHIVYYLIFSFRNMKNGLRLGNRIQWAKFTKTSQSYMQNWSVVSVAHITHQNDLDNNCLASPKEKKKRIN